MSRFLLAPVGSAGDVFPYIGLAVALQKRGHQVTLMTSGYFAEAARRAEVKLIDYLPAEEFLEAVHDPRLWDPLRGFQFVFQRCIAPHIARQHALALEHGQHDCTVVSSCLGFGLRIAQETHHLRLVTLHLQPAVLWSRHVSPQVGPLPLGAVVPGWLKQALFDYGCRHFIDKYALPVLNDFRAQQNTQCGPQVKLAPITSLVNWWSSPDASLGLFPSWYAPRQPDWPEHVTLTEFPLWTEQESSGLGDPLERFLAAGEPPIVFTPGSAMAFGSRFFRTAVSACRLLRRRGLLVSRFAEQIPCDLPADVMHVPYAPFSQLLPRCAAMVHHGGIGTTSQALAAGIPQLIMPMSHDQPDNAARIRRLGVGDAVWPTWFTPRIVSRRLRRLLNCHDKKSNHPLRRACELAAQRVRTVDPFDATCALLEAFARRDSSQLLHTD